MLMVYVDEFKLSGPADAVKAKRKNIAELPDETRIAFGDPEPLAQFLGRMHEKVEQTKDGKVIRGARYTMDQCFTQCIETYEKLVGPDFKVVKADTPFIAEDKGVVIPTRSPCEGESGHVCPHSTEAL